MKLDRFLNSEEGSTGLALCIPERLKKQNPEVVPGPEDRTELEFDLEFYCDEELVGMADYDRENEIVRVMTLEPTEWHNPADRDFMEMLESTFTEPVVTWYSGFEDGCIGSIYCIVDGYSLIAYRQADGTYKADFLAEPGRDELREAEDHALKSEEGMELLEDGAASDWYPDLDEDGESKKNRDVA